MYIHIHAQCAIYEYISFENVYRRCLKKLHKNLHKSHGIEYLLFNFIIWSIWDLKFPKRTSSHKNSQIVDITNPVVCLIFSGIKAGCLKINFKTWYWEIASKDYDLLQLNLHCCIKCPQNLQVKTLLQTYTAFTCRI